MTAWSYTRLNSNQIYDGPYKEAIAKGYRYYLASKPCLRGHAPSVRPVNTRRCHECQRDYNARQFSIGRVKAWKERTGQRALMLTWARYRHNKRWATVPFDLTVESMHWPTHCPALGIELTYEPDPTRKRPDSATIDRKNSSRGYVLDNVQVISRKANMIKQDATPEEVMAVARFLNGLSNAP